MIGLLVRKTREDLDRTIGESPRRAYWVGAQVTRKMDALATRDWQGIGALCSAVSERSLDMRAYRARRIWGLLGIAMLFSANHRGA